MDRGRIRHFMAGQIESAIEDANIPGIVPHYTAVFPHCPRNPDTEVLVVIYLPSYSKEDAEARVDTVDQIFRVSVMQSGTRPYAIIPLEKSLLPKSALGKLSRAKLRVAFKNRDYCSYQYEDEKIVKAYCAARLETPSDQVEDAILACFFDLFNVSHEEVGLNTSLFEWGVNSIQIIKLKIIIQHKLELKQEIPVITVMSNPMIKGLAAAVRDLQKPHEYNPIVTLQSGGLKTPLFLVHSGVGEVLVFLNLAKYIVDRPVHAIRARGFDGEPFFRDLPEVIGIYYDAIKKTQPKGPYAVAGYSYGAMIAFELAKRLQASGEKVAFLGSFNLPPHIKFRMKQLDSIEVLLNFSSHAQVSDAEALDHIMSKAPEGRMDEMALDRAKFQRWVGLAHVMSAFARDYEPSGMVATMDVFYAIPLSMVSKDKADWRKNHLSKWQDFVREEVVSTEVDGTHYTMMSLAHVLSFSKKLRQALANRGL